MVYRVQSNAVVNIDPVECKEESRCTMKKYAQIYKDAGAAS